jgi:hypothetical protein
MEHLRIFTDYLSQRLESFLRVWAVFHNQIDVKRGSISDEKLSVAIEDQSSWRRQIDRPQSIVLGTVPKVLALYDLEVPQTQNQYEQAEKRNSERHPDTKRDVE